MNEWAYLLLGAAAILVVGIAIGYAWGYRMRSRFYK